MEDAEAEREKKEVKRLAKQAAERAAANKFAADKRTSLDQLSAMEGKYWKHLDDNKKELEDLHTQIRKHERELSYINREHKKELVAKKNPPREGDQGFVDSIYGVCPWFHGSD
jgi:hypothetical protein